MFYPKAERNQEVGLRKVVDEGEIVVISATQAVFVVKRSVGSAFCPLVLCTVTTLRAGRQQPSPL